MKNGFSAGDVIESRCTRCRRVTNHIIVAMVRERVVRVQCSTCDGVHNYYPPEVKAKTGPAPRTTTAPPRTPKAGTRRAQAAETEEWQELSRGHSGPHRVYEMDGAFKQGDLLQHHSFGVGVVTSLVKPNKMEVLFQDGRKVLRCRL